MTIQSRIPDTLLIIARPMAGGDFQHALQVPLSIRHGALRRALIDNGFDATRWQIVPPVAA